MGVAGLEGVDKIRTETANLVYEATAIIIGFCFRNHIVCSVANPENSLFWLYPDILAVMPRVQGFSTVFDNCMQGGKRKKHTKWWATDPIFEQLHSLCDGLISTRNGTPVEMGTI